MGEDLKTWKVGNVEIVRLTEVKELVIAGTDLMFDATPETIKGITWLVPDFATSEGKLLFSMQCFLIRAGGRNILVDTCVGNHKPHPEPRISDMTNDFLSLFKKAGTAIDQIDTVLCTHMHFDHVGWNTRLENGAWVPTFTKARYLFSKTEWEHAKNHEPHEGSLNDHMAQSVTPLFDAGLVDLVDSDHHLTDEIYLEAAPGHTPGHVIVWIESNGRRAVITGDLMHHPLQCAHPRLKSHFCFEPDRACDTREAILKRVSDQPILFIGSHFSGPTAGYVVGSGGAWRLKTRIS